MLIVFYFPVGQFATDYGQNILYLLFVNLTLIII
jgi:hypothetical protein